MTASVDERKAAGLAARERTPLAAHKKWQPATGRPDPVAVLEEQDAVREQDLVPVRHGRMMVSPFTFYRGGAAIMAADLAPTPVAGLDAQLCGDAHLSNFGAFAAPDRRLLFDLNDFDETLPGPFEYDVKRMAASFMIAARNNGFAAADARAVTRASVASYRQAMASFAQMGTMEVWYARLDEDELTAGIRTAATAGARTEDKLRRREETQALKVIRKARTRDSLQALAQLGEVSDGRHRIASRPPILVPLRELDAFQTMSADAVDRLIREQFRTYRSTLEDNRRHLLERFQVVDVARKVVGVGSVGTWAFIVLLLGRDAQDPLFLQVKQATSSVLEPHLGPSRYRSHGERVVRGQRMMQAASDIFLGWTKGPRGRYHFYWRQLRDMKGSAVVEAMLPSGMNYYAGICGWTLARAHARSGDPVAMAAYLGDSDAFDKAIANFAARYADQNERDYEEFVTAIRKGRLEAVEGV
ncbi:MAG TPA: DUF2252 domain-containing protein [Phytomonospora sp.]